MGFQRLFPHHGNSFYAKGKLLKRDLPENKATLVIDIIRKCSFGCDFCFASDTRKYGDWTGLDELMPLLSELRGIQKITLIGGEPFEHPEINRLVGELWRTVSGEIEIFTNGAAIPGTFSGARDWARNLTEGMGKARLRLTLAVDRWHRQGHGAERFEALINTLIELEREGRIKAMFNVTDPRIYTGDYMDFPSMEAVLSDLSELLLERFKGLLASRRVEDSFYLNPIIVQGRQGEDGRAELLKPVDFLFHPENVVTKRKGRLVALSALNALWMEAPPAALVLGEDLGKKAGEVFLEGVAGRRLDFDRSPWLRPAFLASLVEGEGRLSLLNEAEGLHDEAGRPDPALSPLVRHLRSGEDGEARPCFEAAVAYADFMDFLESREAVFKRMADSILALSRNRGGSVPPYDLTGRRDFDKLRLPVMSLIIGRFVETRGETSVFSEAVDLWRAVLEGGGAASPALVAEEQSLGHLPESGPVPVPLSRTSLDTGFGLWPDEGAGYVVRPELVLREGNSLRVGLKGLRVVKMGLSAHDTLADVRRLLAYWDLIYGPLAERLRAEIVCRGKDPWSDALNRLLDDEARNPLKESPERFFGSLSDAFEYITFDPNRNRVPWDNPVLLRLLIDRESYPGYGEDEAERFHGTLRYWEAYYAKGKGGGG